jgi:hypothetical protein
MRTCYRMPRKRNRAGIVLAAVAAAWATPTPAAAQQTDWIDGTSNWSNPANWDNGEPLTADETVNILDADAVDRTISYDYSGTAETLGVVNVSNSGGGANILSLSTAGLALITSGENIGGYPGSTGNGAITQSAGSNTIAGGFLSLGYNPGDTGTYALGGGTLALSQVGPVFTGSQYEYIGYAGTGAFVQSGGTNTLPYGGIISVGNNPGSTGTYSLSGGTLNGGDYEYVGYYGAGSFNQSGGSNNAGSVGVIIGDLAGSAGTYNQSGGSNGGLLILGDLAGSTGTYNLCGTGTVGGAEFVGYYGSGVFNQTGGMGTIFVLSLGREVGSTGTYNLTGTGSLAIGGVDGNLGAEQVGESGDGTFNQTGGTNTGSSMTLLLGGQPGSTGTYTLSGTSFLLSIKNDPGSSGAEIIGNGGVGNLIQSGGTNSFTGAMYLGYAVGSTGTYTLRNYLICLNSGNIRGLEV